jgi:hypothetical protein
VPRCCPKILTSRLFLASTLTLILGLPASSACGVRRPVQNDAGAPIQPVGDGGLIVGDGPLQIPDAPGSDGPTICDEPRALVERVADPRGQFALALRPGLTTRAISVAGASPKTSAMTIDHPRVAALAASRLATGLPMADLASWRERLKEHPGLTLTVRSSGIAGSSAWGDPDIKEAVWNIASEAATDIASLRNRALALLLERPLSQLSGLPGAVSRKATSFVLTATLVVRGGQQLVSAALAARDHHDADVGGDAALIDDLGNGTALGLPAQTLDHSGCDRGPSASQGKADILWVIDESGSMRDNREAIAKHAAAFFAKAAAAGLDFRMGVTGMIQPGEEGTTPGKLCSKISQNPKDDGGEDRFLLPGEQQTFLSCVRNPPFEEAGTEYGLAAIWEVLERHLPRAAAEPGRVRVGAKLAIVLVTDEAPQEIKLGGVYNERYGFIKPGEFAPSQCTLDGEDTAQLASYIQPWLDLLEGKVDPEATATVHLIGGGCGNSCKAEVPHGYRELVARTGGLQADICQGNLGQTLQLIVDSIVAAASPRTLVQRPVSASLRVAANGLELPRSKRKGYHYSAATNSLSFFHVKLTPGTELVVSYSRFD